MRRHLKQNLSEERLHHISKTSSYERRTTWKSNRPPGERSTHDGPMSNLDITDDFKADQKCPEPVFPPSVSSSGEKNSSFSSAPSALVRLPIGRRGRVRETTTTDLYLTGDPDTNQKSSKPVSLPSASSEDATLRPPFPLVQNRVQNLKSPFVKRRCR